tara:strand:+ start:1095 stop:2015 length:921 start_codon:yes stop_codon:yes gene_type:complete
MANRRKSNDNEVSLFPFLSILACLIGALVLIIVVLVVAQAGKAEGRTPEEIKMAQDYQRMQKEIEERKKTDEELKKKIEELEKLQTEVKEKEERWVKLRKLLDSSAEVQEQNLKISQELQKELDDLLIEIEGIQAAMKETQKEIAALKAELEKRKVPEDKKVPPVVVQPSGSGMTDDTKVFFVEAASGGLKIKDAWGEDYRLSAKAEVVVADHAYNYLLTEIAKNPKALLLFLIRDDGQGAFNNGAGRAEADYGIRVGKLPIPGRGELDLAFFDKYRGKLPPPPPPPEAPDEPAPEAKPEDMKKAK